MSVDDGGSVTCWLGNLKEGDLAATVSLATGLPAGTHTVTLMARSMDETQSRWTPPLVSSTTLLGFTVTNCVVSFVIGVVVFAAGLYGRTGAEAHSRV